MKQIILFGTGTSGKTALMQYGINNIAFFCSNNSRRRGTYFCGIKVISFEELTEIHAEYRVIVTVQPYVSYSEISAQLDRAGIPFEHFTPDEYLQMFVGNTERISQLQETVQFMNKALFLEAQGIHIGKFLLEHPVPELAFTNELEWLGYIGVSSELSHTADGLSQSVESQLGAYGSRKASTQTRRILYRAIDELYFRSLILPDNLKGKL